MYCSRRLYKGDSYQICLPIADTGVTSVRFYTTGDMVIEKEGEFIDDMMCFELTKEELDLLPDGVLRYTYDGFDSNTEYVVVTPGDYSGSTLDDLLEEAFDSGYTAGQEDCSGGTTDEGLIANLQGDYFYIPEGTTRLRDCALQQTQNYGFSGIVIPNSVITIGHGAFRGNPLLESITIPSSVETVGDFAFFDCSGLTAMTFDGVTPPIFSPNYPLGQYFYTFPIYVPCESVEVYKTALGEHYAERVTCVPGPQPEPVYSAMPMTFRIISGGTLSWYNGQESFGNDYSYCELKYRVNGGEWGAIANNNSFDPEHIASSITLSSGDYVEFATDRINYSLVDSTSGIHFKFKASSALRYNVEGNIMSILYPIGEFETATSYPESYRSNWFAELFAIENTQEEGGVVDASRLVLPVTALTPACYQDMFYQCAHLVSAPALPATTLAGYCYQEMFMGCTSLTSAPELPAPVLTDWCYAQMFSNCHSLNFVKCLATDISVNDCTVDWLKSVPAEGTFEKAPGMTSWPSGDSGIPTGWTVVDAT